MTAAHQQARTMVAQAGQLLVGGTAPLANISEDLERLERIFASNVR